MEDVTPLVESAARGGQLLPAEIQAVAVCLRSAHHIRKHLAPLATQVPRLASVARGIADLSALIQAIERTIGPRGEVLDSASPPLRGLRHAVRETHDRLLERLQRTLASAMGQGIAQESIITERDGRYVIPIKAESRGHLRGVVHDLSSSGATVFVEPLDAVDLGNAWREARADEAHEIERVLRRLSDAIGAESGPIRAAVAALGEIDFAFAKARLAEELDAGLPQEGADQGWLVEAPAEFRLQTARHPLLSGEVVPIALAIGGESRGMLVTGPNTGGKTVALKTVGLLALMAQAGLPVPAEVGSQFPVYGSVFADIGDEQSIAQSLSTFSSHMRNIIQIVNEAGPETLVLLDELGAGTDPAEGTALGRAVLQHLLDVGATVVATTHHGELKLFAAETAGMINASVEFDPETLAPTYRLAVGLPGRSNAIAIAERLGMPAPLLRAARMGFAPSRRSVDTLLEEVQRERTAAADASRAERIAREEAETIRRRLGERLERIDAEERAILTRGEREMEERLAALQREIRAAERALQKGDKAAVTQALDHAAAGRDELERVRAARRRVQERRRPAPPRPPDPTRITPGDIVHLRGLDQPGEALSAVEADGMIAIQLGALHTRVRAEQIERIGGSRPEQSDARPLPPPPSPGARIELRGQTVDEALPNVATFLDQAYRAGERRLEVVHGKGTGTLRQAVRELLTDHPLVSRYAPAAREEGGEGVTIVYVAV